VYPRGRQKGCLRYKHRITILKLYLENPIRLRKNLPNEIDDFNDFIGGNRVLEYRTYNMIKRNPGILENMYYCRVQVKKNICHTYTLEHTIIIFDLEWVCHAVLTLNHLV